MLDCILLKDRSLILVVGLGPEISFQASLWVLIIPHHIAICWLPTQHIIFLYSTGGEKKKRTPKKNMDGRGTGSHGKKTFRNGPVVKQEGMVFGFRKTAAAVTRPER